jgi:flagellar basal-body rod protein FlgG
MRRTRFLAWLAVGFFVGCSQAEPDQVADSTCAEPQKIVANKAVPISAAAAQADLSKVVKASNVEPLASQLPASPAAAAPSLLTGVSTPDLSAGPAGGCREASRVLDEGIKALKTKLTVISHNLANAETIGFKRRRIGIETSGYEQVKLPGAQDAFNNYAPTSVAVGRGCRVQCIEIDFSQGLHKATSRPLDLAIEGEGFFQVIDPSTNNFLYTRSGNFAVNANGLLVIGSSSTGRLLQPQIAIPIDVTGVAISAEGNVSIQQFGQQQFSQVGQIQLAKFMNPQGLLALGEELYQETLASGAAIYGQPALNGLGTLKQHALEQSNVDFDDEMLAWEATHHTLQALERLRKTPATSPRQASPAGE